MPKISVVMPVYNTPQVWLKEAIESILNQTYSDFEFIIVNDGSTNNAEEVILSYKDNRIKYIKQENQGIANALNNGIAIATGEYIARMDSDDISIRERFEKQVNYLDTNPHISLLGTWFKIFPNGNISRHPSEPKYLDILRDCYIGHPTVMFRRKDFEKFNLKYNPEYKCEDYELWSRAIRHLKFANLEEVLLQYRSHENNLSKPTDAFMTSVRQVQYNMLQFLTSNEHLQIELFELEHNNHNTLLQNIFSSKNTRLRTHKIITILGKKFYIKRKKK